MGLTRYKQGPLNLWAPLSSLSHNRLGGDGSASLIWGGLIALLQWISASHSAMVSTDPFGLVSLSPSISTGDAQWGGLRVIYVREHNRPPD